MTPEQIIKEAEDYASEWMEMTNDPAALVAGVLATKIMVLYDYIDYLERRLIHDSITRIN